MTDMPSSQSGSACTHLPDLLIPTDERVECPTCGATWERADATRDDSHKPIHMVPDDPRLPSASWEHGEGLLLTLPSLHRTAIYVSVYVSVYVHRGRSHIGWGRQFLDEPQPWWAHCISWGRF